MAWLVDILELNKVLGVGLSSTPTLRLDVISESANWRGFPLGLVGDVVFLWVLFEMGSIPTWIKTYFSISRTKSNLELKSDKLCS